MDLTLLQAYTYKQNTVCCSEADLKLRGHYHRDLSSCSLSSSGLPALMKSPFRQPPPRPLSLPLSPETSSLGLTLRRPAVPVVSGSSAGLAGVRLMMPEMETGSTEGAVKGSGRRGPVGRRELGKVDCSTGSLGAPGLANCAATQGVGA